MTTEQIMSMTAEEFKNATVDDRLEALKEVIESFQFHKEWCEKYQWMDKRNWEYRMHKKYMLTHRNRICSWLNALGIETLPFED